ncbi:alpha-2-macroglobulin-like [Hyperolius riggenbachi]|uniref:alpha-2-macroglobulin-like n=1 Tax=Hyperolius riggenbachi TaxID=752182 RepID=UPI0035A3038D
MGLPLLLFICLFAFAAPTLASSSEPYYMVTVPAQLMSLSSKACVTFHHLQGETKLKMELKRNETVRQVAEDSISAPDYFHCYPFQVPSAVDGEEVWFLHVSLKAENLQVDQSKKILVYKQHLSAFIQVEKPYYKPGQTVNFRIVLLNQNFQAEDIKYPLVEITDPDDNRLAQWLDVSPQGGIASLSFPLANELSLGEYTINIPNFYRTTFTVAEMERKRFELKIDLPPVMTVLDNNVTVKACGSYIYGKPVQGLMDLSICKATLPLWIQNYLSELLAAPESTMHYLEDTGDCERVKGVQTDHQGCLSETFELSLLNISQAHPLQSLKVEASLTEGNTGDTEQAKTFNVLRGAEILTFVEKHEFYQKGVPLNVTIQVVDKRGLPKASEKVYLVLGFETKDKTLSALTDENGLAVFILDTSKWDDMVSLMGSFTEEEKETEDKTKNSKGAFYWVYPFYSESNSFLKVTAHSESLLCSTQQSVMVEYIINRRKLDPSAKYQTFYYFIMSVVGISSYGEYKLDTTELSSGTDVTGSFHLKFSKTVELFPRATVIVFTILLDGDVAAGKTLIELPVCLNNKVQLKFSKDEVHPGEKVGLEVKAEPGSLCSVRSVDRGVLLNRKHEAYNLPTDTIKYFAYKTQINRRGFPYSIEDFEKYPCMRSGKDTGPAVEEGVWVHSEADVYRLLKESNLKVFTNTKIRKPVACNLPQYTKRKSTKIQRTEELDAPVKPAQKKDIQKEIRSFFPDTWLFDLISVGPEGSTVVSLTTPDSITKYVTDGFCLGKSGFGETDNVVLTTFQPYFIELIVPHSVVQGERFTITALIYNYLKECIMVFVSLSDVGDHSALKSKDQTRCVCAEESTNFSWNVTASQLGELKAHVSSGYIQLEGGCSEHLHKMGKDHQVDNIEKTILVKPPGDLEEKTQAVILCPSDNTAQAELTLSLPEGYISGSEQAHIAVLGDIMGIAVSKLESVIYASKGSGERNLEIFVSNAQVVKYLQATKQLTPKFKEKAVKYMITGYQRQLLFKNENGSYSLFNRFKPSTWLTAFTLRSFVHAKELIYIQEKHIDDAVKWLSSLQLPNGCFQEVGESFNNYLTKQGEDEVTRTAYIAIALMEHGQVFDGSVVERALKCLKDSVGDVSSPYTQAMLAYVFTLSGDENLRKRMLDSLEESAEKTDDSKHWEMDEDGHGAVEISAYVVLALLSGQATSQKEIEEASSIVRWMAKKQGWNLGSLSTQDTVLQLQALAKFAKVTYRDNQDVTVTVSGINKQFRVDKAKSLLLQSDQLPDIPGEYTVKAEGDGCVYVQTHLKYHTPPEKLTTYFFLNVTTQPSVCTLASEKRFQIQMDISYTGERPVTNVVLIEVGILSGFLPAKRTIRKLEKEVPGVKRTEITAEKVTIYMDKLTQFEPVTLVFSTIQEDYVDNLQPAIVKVYDSSSPDEHAESEYNSPCSSDSESNNFF